MHIMTLIVYGRNVLKDPDLDPDLDPDPDPDHDPDPDLDRDLFLVSRDPRSYSVEHQFIWILFECSCFCFVPRYRSCFISFLNLIEYVGFKMGLKSYRK